jgi:hypothetical protein
MDGKYGRVLLYLILPIMANHLKRWDSKQLVLEWIARLTKYGKL